MMVTRSVTAAAAESSFKLPTWSDVQAVAARAHELVFVDARQAGVYDLLLVLGVRGGFGGMLTAANLIREGVEDFMIVEKGGDFGGTWYWNRYPGCMCDVESYTYLPLLNGLFDSRPLSLLQVGVALAAGVVVFLVVELLKLGVRRPVTAAA